jgi:tetratricopeptide (TPR) repeat protein
MPGEPTGDRPGLVPDRIVVLAFENRTGDPELDLLGRLAADVLTRGLAQAGIGEVVLPTEMLAPGTGADRNRSGPLHARAVASELLAGISVSGSIDPGPEGPTLVTVVATGPGARVAAVLDPEPVDPDSPGPALERLGSRVVGTLAAHLGQALPEHPFVVRTPSYESYRAADRATSLFLERRFDRAAALFRRAFELDSTGVGYLLWEGVAYQNLRDSARVWEIVEELRLRRDELTPFDAAHFDWLEARVVGNLRGSFEAARRAHALHPHSGLGGFQLGLELLRLGRPAEAVEAFERLDPDRGWLAGFLFYWHDLADAYHVLGRHEEELRVAEEGYRRFPGPELLDKRLRALAALGRIPELERALRESTDPPSHALTAARALHRHGMDSLSVALAEEGLRALSALPQVERPLRRGTEARLLIAAGRLQEARSLLLGLLEVDPTDHDLLGWTGVVEARLGLAEEARTRIQALQLLGREPFSQGNPTMARAAIHAELGDDPALVRLLLEQSHREGRGMHHFHFTPLFDPVRDHPDVRGFFAPVDSGGAE